MPLNPQHTIINKDTFISMGPSNVTGICDSRRKAYDSDEEIRHITKHAKSSKKFIF